MRFEIRHEAHGTVDLALDGVTLLGASSSSNEDVLNYVAIRMTHADFESLVSAMTTTRVRELHRSLDDTLELVKTLSDERDAWKERAEGGLSRAGVNALSGVHRAARVEHAKYPDEAREFHKSIDALERVAVSAVYEENESGGHARQVVADVARVLGVDLDEGPGRRWDPDHMARVVGSAKATCDERDDLREQVALWKTLAERQDNTAPLRRELLLVKSERDELKGRLDYLKYQVDALPTSDGADELRAVIVSQAREIARLKGESE
ncbi:hypothetical protein [Streptomyces sp. DH12]|uniref:hypothetical protein n=1 Tax=Streptomyces sp. DH12 TaxID=2857010 RepID=UPI001E649FCE|nr:hypothetical protein [Streptomyces sp. DH12]